LPSFRPADSYCLTGDFYIKSQVFSRTILHVSITLESFTNASEAFHNALVNLNYAQLSFSNTEEGFYNAL
jgi:hypothetical protein